MTFSGSLTETAHWGSRRNDAHSGKHGEPSAAAAVKTSWMGCELKHYIIYV